MHWKSQKNAMAQNTHGYTAAQNPAAKNRKKTRWAKATWAEARGQKWPINARRLESDGSRGLRPEQKQLTWANPRSFPPLPRI